MTRCLVVCSMHCTDNFGRICCLLHQNRPTSSTLMEAAVGIHYRTTRCHVPEDCCLHTHCRENYIHHNKKSIFNFSIHILQKIFLCNILHNASGFVRVYASANMCSLSYEMPGIHASINNVLCMQFWDVFPKARVDVKAGSKINCFDRPEKVK